MSFSVVSACGSQASRMLGDTAGACGEAAEFLTGSVVSLWLLNASCAPTPITCPSDSLSMVCGTYKVELSRESTQKQLGLGLQLLGQESN